MAFDRLNYKWRVFRFWLQDNRKVFGRPGKENWNTHRVGPADKKTGPTYKFLYFQFPYKTNGAQ